MPPTTSRYRTMLRGAFLDQSGNEHHFVYQSTQSSWAVAADAVVLRPAVEAMFAQRGCELLTLQMVGERPQVVDLDDLLGRKADPTAESAANVIAWPGPRHGEGA